MQGATFFSSLISRSLVRKAIQLLLNKLDVNIREPLLRFRESAQDHFMSFAFQDLETYSF